MGEVEVSAIAHVIQLSVAPVFLLSGIGAILAVMTSRLSRIIDRARLLEGRLEDASPPAAVALEADLETLTHRARLIGPAITLCTVTALLVCTVIAILFLSAFLRFDASIAVALLFVAAMCAFFLGLLWFLREIFVATKNLRIGSRHVHGSGRRVGAVVLLLGVAGLKPCATVAVANQPVAQGLSPAMPLPAGVTGVSFGSAQRYKDTSGKEMCAIVQPVSYPPVFERGVTEISYGVHLEPRAVKSASTLIMAPGAQGQLRRQPCNVFTLVERGFSQTQLGSTISRADKKPLVPGSYTLRITVDGHAVDIPFEIGR